LKRGSAVILGGGMAGMASAHALASEGWETTVVEAGPVLGGLAGSFQRNGHSFPLGYHHILGRDRTLLRFLDLIGALEHVRWRRIRMLFRVNGRNYDLKHPADFLSFPMRSADKARFAGLMLRAFRKENWDDWHHRSAEALLDEWASPGVRETLFEPLTRIKFDLPCSQVSAAWLGARLNHREGSAPLGYIPGRNWTEVLCTGLAQRLSHLGVRVLTGTKVVRIVESKGAVREVETQSGNRIGGDVFISTFPTEILGQLLPAEDSFGFRDIAYTALTSVICAVPEILEPDFYWMNLFSTEHAASGLFLLNSLNPTLGTLGETYVNFVTHTRSRSLPFFAQRSEEEVVDAYRADFHKVFGKELNASWIQVNRVPMYSPVFVRDYKNPPVRSTSFGNLYFAGNFRTYPSVVSTGTALQSGLEAAETILGVPGAAAR